ncbi:ABC-2 type transporter [Sphaerochaeta pleomorpha str. Grapes]|uniref:Transport permease protein n=1 Tax=Sphaerochaeta pleomorpha (strain ATCC BAA-1885 / DSM 22778 / Grapes) TaxID=158190 RepID=G8QUV5_SPHPG|nr:ABC transporter permease [Sphaerochaeta pleomorpha]AEV28131.1 ABC-2 type transporter [Sphaerochaeta pleomorpha str. Grapes]
MSAYSYHLMYDIRTGLRDKSLMLMNYLFPLGFLLLAGLFMTQVNPFFKDIMIPGMILFGIMSSTLLNLSSIQIQARETGIFRSYRVNGVKLWSLVSIPILSSSIHSVLVSAIVTVLSLFLFDAAAPVNWWWFFVVLVTCAVCLSTIGMLIGIVSPSARAGILLAQMVFIPSVILGGLMVPAAMIPANLQFIVSLLPASHGIQAFNNLSMGSGNGKFEPLVILLVSSVVNLVLCLALFQWEAGNHAGKKKFFGLLALLPFLASYVV